MPPPTSDVMMSAMRLTGLVLALFLAQDPQKKVEPAVDYLFLQDRTELQGEIVEFGQAGRMKVRVNGLPKAIEVSLEDLARLRFSADETRPGNPAGEQIRLAGGGMVSGKLASYSGDVALLETTAGPLRIRRQDVKAMLLGTPGTTLELRDEKKDILIREIEKKVDGTDKTSRECVAEYGRLKSVGEKVVFQSSVEGKDQPEDREFDRASVKHVYFHREAGQPEFPPGLFSKVTLRNGDRWVAVLQSVTRDRLRLFSHLFGTVEVEKSKIHSLSFIQQAQLTAGNILITDQSGVREFDSQKQEVWSYTAGAQGAAIARKLRNGNVLVADPNTNSVLEIRPGGRTGGEVVW